MAISPIAIATQGVLNSPLSVAAVRGRLTIPLRPPGSGTKKGPSFVQGEWEHPYVRLERQIQREDEEILVVIGAFLRAVQK